MKYSVEFFFAQDFINKVLWFHNERITKGKISYYIKRFNIKITSFKYAHKIIIIDVFSIYIIKIGFKHFRKLWIDLSPHIIKICRKGIFSNISSAGHHANVYLKHLA